MVLPDIFMEQDNQATMYEKAKLDAQSIVAKALEALNSKPRIRRRAAGRLPFSSRGAARAERRCGSFSRKPRGFCAGVVRAIEIVERALEKYGPPVYVRHEIVHNKHVVESLKAKGAHFVEELARGARWTR